MLHLVGFLLTLNYDARNHELKNNVLKFLLKSPQNSDALHGMMQHMTLLLVPSISNFQSISLKNATISEDNCSLFCNAHCRH